MRILRTETLDHFIFLSTDHVHRVVAEYVHYDNGARPVAGDPPDPRPDRSHRPHIR